MYTVPIAVRAATNETLTGRMMMNTEVLNAAVSFLRSLGINVGTDAASKNAVISLVIKTLVDAGFDAKTAFDAIVGAGSFDTLASDVHKGLAG